MPVIFSLSQQMLCSNAMLGTVYSLVSQTLEIDTVVNLLVDSPSSLLHFSILKSSMAISPVNERSATALNSNR